MIPKGLTQQLFTHDHCSSYLLNPLGPMVLKGLTEQLFTYCSGNNIAYTYSSYLMRQPAMYFL